MKIFTEAFAYGLADDLVRSVEARAGEGVTTMLMLHSRHPDVVRACERLAERPPGFQNYGRARRRDLSGDG